MSKEEAAPPPNDPLQIIADELEAFVDRIEDRERDRRAAARDIKEIYAEAKGRGYDTAIIRKIVADKRKGMGAVFEQESTLAHYRMALGLGLSRSDL